MIRLRRTPEGLSLCLYWYKRYLIPSASNENLPSFRFILRDILPAYSYYSIRIDTYNMIVLTGIVLSYIYSRKCTKLTRHNTGTSGGLGSVVLDTILDQKLIAPSEIRLSTYSGQTKSTKAIAEGIEVRRGDIREPETLLHAYAGAECVFLVSYPSVGEERYVLHRNAIDAAKKAGVKHIIYTSLTFGGVDGEQSGAGVMQAHIKTANYLKASGLSWTIIREAIYAHLWNNFAGFIPLEGTDEYDVVIPSDGPNTWASRQDLGEGTGQIVGNWVRDLI